MRLCHASWRARCRALLRAAGLAALIVVASPVLALLLLPILLCAAPVALIGLPFLVSALLPELLCVREADRLRALQLELERQVRRARAAIERLGLSQ